MAVDVSVYIITVHFSAVCVCNRPHPRFHRTPYGFTTHSLFPGIASNKRAGAASTPQTAPKI
jgi:hypothetical protein